MSRRVLGLDWVETGIHVFVTICVAVGLSEVAGPTDEDLAMALTFAASAVVFGIRRRRALLRAPEREEGLTTGEMAAERLADLEARVADLEILQERLVELEGRVDFSERLLARSGPAGRTALPGESGTGGQADD